jgi:hypothetical protein
MGKMPQSKLLINFLYSFTYSCSRLRPPLPGILASLSAFTPSSPQHLHYKREVV